MASNKANKPTLVLTPKPKGKITLTPKLKVTPKASVPFNKTKYTA